MIEKIADPTKMVTDPVLLNVLSKRGIDKDYVEFVQDYAPRSLGKEHSPYAKFYRDLKSNRRFMVVSGLPMVNAFGVKVEPSWIFAEQTYTSRVNQFQAQVKGTKVALTVINDQPDGRKLNDRLTYQPRFYLNEVERTCGKPSLLPVDPINSNYLENTHEWDYGICKRRLRIIEGSILGSWVFASKPAGGVRIKYNQTGDYKLRLGRFKINDDEEVVKLEDFDELANFQGGYPVTISDSATFYPDADPETTTVDGVTYRDIAYDADFATTRAGDGTGAMPSDTGLYGIANLRSGIDTPQWRSLYRSYYLFNVASLAGATVSAAVFSLYGWFKSDTGGWTPTTNVYPSNPTSNTNLVAGDYNIARWSDTTALSTAISFEDWLVADPFWNNFTLNAAGIALVQAAANGDGIAKLGVRNTNYDVANSAPLWVSNKLSNISAYFSEQGNGYKPKLVIEYTTGVSIPVAMHHFNQMRGN